MNKVWNEVERDFVREHVEQLSDEQGAVKLSLLVGRPISTFSYRKQRQKMGLAKQQGRGVNKLRANTPSLPPEGQEVEGGNPV